MARSIRPQGAAAVRRAVEAMEGRLLFAAHVVGSPAVYATIQAAVDNAPAGGTVTVDAGTYAEQVTITQPLTIEGARAGVDGGTGGRRSATDATESIVTGAVSGSVNTFAFHVLADDVTIDGFTVAGETDPDAALGAGIVIGPGHSGTHVVNDVVKNNVAGLFLANASPTDAAVVQHDYFGNNNNDGANGGRGIYTDQTISGGNLTNVTIDSDTFNNNYGGAGTTRLEAAVAFEAADPGHQSDVRVTNSSFTGNGKATLFFNTDQVLIRGNTVSYCLDQWSGALRFEGGDTNVSILYNNLNHNTGPAVAADSKGTPADNAGFVVNDNNFYGNSSTYAVPMSVVANFNTYDGTFDARDNYWGAPSGPSGEGSGTGDAVGDAALADDRSGWHLTGGADILYSPWATAPVPATPTVPAPPTGLTAAAVAPTQIDLDWTDNAPANEAGFVVQRSADGGATFAQIGTTAAGVTAYTDTAVSPQATYAYRVYAVNAAGTSAASNDAPATTPSTAGLVYLSDLAYTSATTGYGTVQKDASISGNPITLRGAVYAKGVGTHAASTITYALNGGYATFATDAGIDDDAAGRGSVDFQVIGDGTVLFDSGIVTGASPAAHVNVSVAGVNTLQIVATNGAAGSIDYDHADWANARLTAAAPTAPSNLMATPASSSQINLTWTAATGQTAYAVDRTTDGGATWTPIATPTVTNYADTGLSAGTTYTYRVRATNAAGSSAASGKAQATTTAAPTVPRPPASLTATVASATSINLTWTAATGQTAYAVDRSTDGGATWATVATPTTTTYGDAGLTAGMTYTYQVRATNAVGSSAASNTATATTAAAPAVPTAPSSLTATAASATQVNLTWAAATGQIAYAVDRSTDGGATWTIVGTPTTTSYGDAGLTAGTTYTYRVRATNAVGSSAASNTATATTTAAPTVPTAPSSLTATAASATQVNLTWAAATGQIAYAVDRSTDGGATWTIVGTPTTTSYGDAGLTAGTTYTYQVRATNAVGSSAASTTATATTPTPTPTPTRLTGATYGTAGANALNPTMTVAQATDGDLTTFFDSQSANGNYVAIDLGSARVVTQIGYAPRGGLAGRMVGGTFQASGTADFSSGVATVATVTAAPAAGVLTTVTPSTTAAYRYWRYVAPNGSYGNIAEFELFGTAGSTTPTPTATMLTGTTVGTAGSYNNAGNTISKATDGNLATFFDAPTANGNWVGLDLGAAGGVVTTVKYASRAGFAARMNGGRFQASNAADFSNAVTLYTIPANANPASASLTTVNLANATAYRYYRYLGPAGSYGNISELQLFGTPGSTTPTPTRLTGATYGTAGANALNPTMTVAQATDGDLATFFDSQSANGNYVAVDLGTARVVTQIEYAPRGGLAGRMVGGTFQASNSATFAAGVVTVATVATAPAVGVLTTVTPSTTAAYRYWRYVAPNGSYGNIAEFELFG